MDKYLPAFKGWNKKASKTPQKLLILILENSFTVVTYNFFFHKKKFAQLQIAP